jgi:hypothetical protein
MRAPTNIKVTDTIRSIRIDFMLVTFLLANAPKDIPLVYALPHSKIIIEISNATAMPATYPAVSKKKCGKTLERIADGWLLRMRLSRVPSIKEDEKTTNRDKDRSTMPPSAKDKSRFKLFLKIP